MKHILIVLVMLCTQILHAQSAGYEMRTNGKSYIAVTFKGIELRHRTDDLENRFTYISFLNSNYGFRKSSGTIQIKMELLQLTIPIKTSLIESVGTLLILLDLD
mgnify:CR=1 FL=1